MEASKKHPLNVQIVLTLMALLSTVIFLSNCSGRSGMDKDIGKVKTKHITFKCDQHINQGLLLPVDVIYLTTYHLPREITAIGPDKWFNSSERDNWVEKQSLSLKGGETKKLKLNKLWLKNTKLLFVVADFKDVNEPYSQQLIIDRSARKTEMVIVLPRALTFDR